MKLKDTRLYPLIHCGGFEDHFYKKSHQPEKLYEESTDKIVQFLEKFVSALIEAKNFEKIFGDDIVKCLFMLINNLNNV